MSELKPVAWLHCDRPDADVVTDKVKNVWGGVVLGSLAQYSIPLYTGEVFERCLSDIAALKKAHREAVEFSNDLLIENGELKNINEIQQDHINQLSSLITEREIMSTAERRYKENMENTFNSLICSVLKK